MTTNTREIKFRAWDADARIMREAIDLSAPSSTYQWLGKEDLPLMQYTGLKDKNGKEIYEGDVLETRLKTFTFRAKLDFGWSRDDVYGLHWTHNANRRGVGSEVRKADGISERMEIIGNIYENSDLLV